MAETLEIDTGITGLTTLQVDLYPYTNDIPTVSGIDLTEQTNRKGIYRGSTSVSMYGLHHARVKPSGSDQPLAIGYFWMTSGNETHVMVDTPTVFHPSSYINRAHTVCLSDDVIGSGALANSAVNEIQNGLATSTSINNLQTSVNNLGIPMQSGSPVAVYWIYDNVINSGALASTAVLEIQNGLATQTSVNNLGIPMQSGSPVAVYWIYDNVINSGALATTAVNEIQNGLATSTSVSNLQTSVNNLGVPMQSGSPVAVYWIYDDVINSGSLSSTAIAEIQNGLATQVSVNNLGTPMQSGSPVAVYWIYDNVINSGSIATSAVSELQSGLATTSNITSLQTSITNLGIPMQSGSPVAVYWIYDNVINSGSLASSAVTEIQNGLNVSVNIDPSSIWFYQTRTLSSGAITDQTISDSAVTKIASGIGSGAGVNVVTITVNDGSAVLANATVSVWNGSVMVATGITNASGIATLNINNGSYTVAIGLSGYNFNGSTLTVSGATSHTYSMTLITFSPASDPAKSNVVISCYDGDTVLEEGVSIEVQQLGAVSGTGVAFEGSVKEYISDSNGLVTLTLWRNAQYRYRRESGNWVTFTPDSASYYIESVLGGA